MLRGHRAYLDLGNRTAPTTPVRKKPQRPINHRQWSDPCVPAKAEGVEA